MTRTQEWACACICVSRAVRDRYSGSLCYITLVGSKKANYITFILTGKLSYHNNKIFKLALTILTERRWKVWSVVNIWGYVGKKGRLLGMSWGLQFSLLRSMSLLCLSVFPSKLLLIPLLILLLLNFSW